MNLDNRWMNLQYVTNSLTLGQDVAQLSSSPFVDALVVAMRSSRTGTTYRSGRSYDLVRVETGANLQCSQLWRFNRIQCAYNHNSHQAQAFRTQTSYIRSQDIGPAIGRAFEECVKGNPGSTLYVPAGNYNMQTWQTLRGATQWAFQMDGVITRVNTDRGHMFVIQDANDFEMYSSNSAGAIQGNGYQCRNAG
jgi:hypothetical protein